eukprot:CAMPEP_0170193432 /NCGR_PEP_ID=MMETSP0040_2-20121228/56840_1 /TAXON_ID=641309 /ORGANISM="Lotharella oceanica, Strain CCMP622" /LENGTH=63 /DNA_ID=CAMNT_0010442055 /DNA_START=144 /DNA_END=332 /DNA_ORIENTATION=-
MTTFETSSAILLAVRLVRRKPRLLGSGGGPGDNVRLRLLTEGDLVLRRKVRPSACNSGGGGEV